MTEQPEPAAASLIEQLQSLDVSQFSTISRMKPTTANLPPNPSQKEHLRRHAAESHILMRIAALWMSTQVSRLVFRKEAVPTIHVYVDQTGELGQGTLDLFEVMKLRELHAKAGIEMDLRALDPKLFGLPISIREDVTGIEAHLKNGEIVNFVAESVEDADSIFKQGNVSDCFLFAFFYLLDQRVLLEGNRRPGQIIPRFLRVYASHTMNQILFTYFDQFMTAYRELMMEGVNEDSITLSLLATVMTRGAR